ncbi:hypothetical protein [Saccharothrix sp. ST-888]|uniref:hypothetical protein n=1 Tax=Saccharothrix sp. ST-888 TaxID=1427391 RepID=UPI0005ED333C|nr:hypothetical protein [Saccharothrix sp. ST-888]KJK55384.1 hypothetical protein UK12_29055 [Saccharothrix sp. ST-888]
MKGQQNRSGQRSEAGPEHGVPERPPSPGGRGGGPAVARMLRLQQAVGNAAVGNAVVAARQAPSAAGSPAADAPSPAGARTASFRTVREPEIHGTFEPGGEQGGAGVVALVPATVGGPDLLDIAERYRDQGFENAADSRRKLALVIGVNAWAGGDKALEKVAAKVDRFRGSWNDDRFPVGVLGFTWSSDAVASVADIGQRTIPYGQLRQHILDQPVVPQLVNGLKELGRTEVYLHTSDSDTLSFRTAAGPLFSAAAERHLDAGAPDLLSGGYATPVADPHTGDGRLVELAGKLDLAVRDAMAGVDPRLVYFPEPNTFVRVRTDWDLDRLEPGIGFGEGANEGQSLVDSTHRVRERNGIEVVQTFDSRLAVTTDPDRIGRKVGEHPLGHPVTEDSIGRLFELAQSHARRQEWADRVAARYGLDPRAKEELATKVYAGLTNVEMLTGAAGLDPRPELVGQKFRDSLNGFDDTVIAVAIVTRRALLNSLLDACRQLTPDS